MEYLFLIIIILFVIFIFLIAEGRFNKEKKRRNGWDIMFFNTSLAILVLFMIGILKSDVWRQVAYALGAVAIGQGISGIFKSRGGDKSIKEKSPQEKKTIPVFKITIIIMLLAVSVSIIIPVAVSRLEKKADFYNRVELFKAENTYDKGIFNSFKNMVAGREEQEEKYINLFWGNFSTKTYRENWNVIKRMSYECKISYLKLIGEMESANLINNSIISMYNQSSLVSSSTQAQILWTTHLNEDYEHLKFSLSKIENFFKEIEKCEFRY